MFKFMAMCFFLFLLVGVIQTVSSVVVALVPVVLLLAGAWLVYRMVR
jgi:hypothetical protein